MEKNSTTKEGMDLKDIKLSVSQIEKMKHAVGLDRPRKLKTSVAYRNFYETDDDPEWNEVVSLGLALKRDAPFWKGHFVYQLNERGIDYLSMVTGKKITFQ